MEHICPIAFSSNFPKKLVRYRVKLDQKQFNEEQRSRSLISILFFYGLKYEICMKNMEVMGVNCRGRDSMTWVECLSEDMELLGL